MNAAMKNNATVSVEKGKASGEKFLARHRAQCPKRPRYTLAWYVEGDMLYVLWPVAGTKRYSYIPYCNISTE